MKNIRDTGLVPEAMYNQISEKGTVYDYVHNKNFPYEKVLELAVTACDGDLQALSELKKVIKLVDHDFPKKILLTIKKIIYLLPLDTTSMMTP